MARQLLQGETRAGLVVLRPQASGKFSQKKVTGGEDERPVMESSGRFMPTVTVIAAQAVATADGRVALALTTKEQGTIAFEVTLEIIAGIRAKLTEAEAVLRHDVGHA